METGNKIKTDDHIFTTLRCGIRELTEADLSAESELYNSPHMTDHIPPLSDREQELQFFKAYAEMVYQRYGYGMWGIFDLETGRLIGEAGLEPRSDVNRAKYPYDWMFDEHSAELGFLIAEDLWGQGYCKEACQGILTYCSEHFGITTAFARTSPDNIASLHVLSGLGFEEYERIPSENGNDTVIIFRKHIS
ncbi:MAG: GNAT family N-acetyltransferase [Lachnospiraceae bacterium]|nr:GNAT family N-acetyltransferase [Lachnospiraceae bacterium]